MKCKPYPEYHDSGVEWLGKIPAHWDARRLKFLSAIIMGQSPPAEHYNSSGDGLPFLQGTADFGADNPEPRVFCPVAPKTVKAGDHLISADEQVDFRGQLTDYVRLYAFLAQVLTFTDTDLEKLYVFARHLQRQIPAEREELPREVQQNIDMESYRFQQTSSGKIALERKTGQLEPTRTKQHYGTPPEELEPLSQIIAELNERFGLNLKPEHRLTLGQMMDKLDADTALDASARANTRENKQDDKVITHAVLKTVAAFLNTEGGDLLIGVADNGSMAGIEQDRLESDDKFMRHLAQVVRNGLGDRAGTCIDPRTQIVQGKTVCLVSCQRSPEPVFLKWKGAEEHPDGDFYVRSGPGSVKLNPESAREYIRTRFPQASARAGESE